MRLQQKSISKVNLLDLLRRRKITLKSFLKESGIVSYSLLVARCKSMGVNVPTENQFNDANDNAATPELSSPTEGVVVLTPPDILSEITGKSQKTVEVDTPVVTDELLPMYNPPSYPRRKKSLDKPKVSKIAEKIQKQQTKSKKKSTLKTENIFEQKSEDS